MTEHSALYRKYRPQTWNDVLGQESVVEILQTAIKDTSFPHALLFAGTRGTGKTSVARIFAREIGARPEDLYEIDAASNRGVDDVRALREEVTSMPFTSPYKVYIIDEVHMLTKEAFNALLKTLEEPPHHVVFILATTELEKLPDTIVSRCQVHRFRTPTIPVLKKLLTTVAKKEGYELSPASADVIALLAEGSFRDAHGALQQAIAYSSDSKSIDADEVSKSLGVPLSSTIQSFLAAFPGKDVDQALRALEESRNANVTTKAFCALTIRLLRAVLLTRASADFKASLPTLVNEKEKDFIEKHATESTATLNSHLLRKLLTVYNGHTISSVPLLPLELLVVEECSQVHDNK
jgi:DNA polymerase-3 subunit gamma/tau